jgi:predicted nucleic acid-binding protein
MTVFVDTSAWYALLDESDPSHAQAARTLRSLADRRERLVTHNYVVVESLALIQRRMGMELARGFVTRLLPVAETEWIQPSLHDTALAAFLESGRESSFVDHISFALMRGRAVSTAFAFDEDFLSQGFGLAR